MQPPRGPALVLLAAALVAGGLWLASRATGGAGERGGVPATPGAGERAPALVSVAPREPDPPVERARPTPTPAPDGGASPVEAEPAERRSALVGRVVDPYGAGVRGQRVVLRREGRPRLERDAAPDGGFRFDGLEPGRVLLELDPEALPAGWLGPRDPALPAGVEVAVPAAEPVELRLVRAGLVTGSVRYADASSAADLAVRLVPAGVPRAPELVTRTDARGAFELDGAQPCESLLLVDHRLDYEGPLVLPPPLAVHPHEGLTLVLDPIVIGAGPAAVRGQVLDGAGAPRAGLTVLCYRPGADGEPVRQDPIGTAVTDAEGRYRFEGIAEPIVFVHPGAGLRSLAGRPQRVELPAGAQQNLPPLTLD